MNVENKSFKLKFDPISNSYVLVQDKNRYNFTPKAFAQRFFYKMGEQNLDEEETSEDIDEELDEELLERIKRTKRNSENQRTKMVFKEGACDDEEAKVLQQPEPFRPGRPGPSRPPVPPRPPQAQQPVQLSRDIYNKLLILNELYGDLLTYNTQYNDEIRDMIAELRIVTFAMLRIYQTLSGRNNIPLQNIRKPRFNGFCNGVVVCINWIRDIMFDIRRLQRLVEITNIDRQLIIINFTLQSQLSQLMQMRQECISGGNL